MAKRKKSGSSFHEEIQATRVVIDPTAMLTCGELSLLNHRDIGIFMRMLPYIARAGFREDVKDIAHMGLCSPFVMARVWPKLKPFFECRADGLWHLKPTPWLVVQTVTAEREKLRHLLARLVDHWGSACVYCGETPERLEIEHIVPIVRGGSDDITNLTVACANCNRRKHAKTAAEFGFPHIHDLAVRAH